MKLFPTLIVFLLPGLFVCAQTKPSVKALEVIIGDGFLRDSLDSWDDYEMVARWEIDGVTIIISDTERYSLNYFSERIWNLTDQVILAKLHPGQSYRIEVVADAAELVGWDYVDPADIDDYRRLTAVIAVARKKKRE